LVAANLITHIQKILLEGIGEMSEEVARRRLEKFMNFHQVVSYDKHFNDVAFQLSGRLKDTPSNNALMTAVTQEITCREPVRHLKHQCHIDVPKADFTKAPELWGKVSAIVNEAVKTIGIAGLANVGADLETKKLERMDLLEKLTADKKDKFDSEFSKFSSASQTAVKGFLDKFFERCKEAVKDYRLPGLKQISHFKNVTDYTIQSLPTGQVIRVDHTQANTTVSTCIHVEGDSQYQIPARDVLDPIKLEDNGFMLNFSYVLNAPTAIKNYIAAYIYEYGFAILPDFEGEYIKIK
jgi:hypothetical protein